MSWTIIPQNFSGAKFAARYGLNPFVIPPDFWLIKDQLYVKPGIQLPDDPPIFEPPDPPGPTIISQIDALPGTVPIALKDVLKRLANGR